MSARQSLDPQAELVARLVELTAQVSMEPLPVSTILNMHRKLDALEGSATPKFTQFSPTSERQNEIGAPFPNPHDTNVTKSRSRPGSIASKSIWSQSLLSSAMTRPTTADTRSTKKEYVPGTTLYQNEVSQAPGQSLQASHEDPTHQPQADLEAFTKSLLADLTALVGKLALRQEESRHINDLALAKADAALQELVRARKTRAQLEQSNLAMRTSFETLSSSMRYLKGSIDRIEARLEALVISIASNGEAEPASYATEAMSIMKRIERWRRDCASIEGDAAKAKSSR